jgi:LysR family cyn operon transcriptional activator
MAAVDTGISFDVGGRHGWKHAAERISGKAGGHFSKKRGAFLRGRTKRLLRGKHHPLASKEKVSIAELEKYELALPSKGLQARNAFDSIAPDFNSFNIRIELNEVNTLLKLIRQTGLVTVLAEDSIYDIQDVKAVPIDVPGNEMTGCVHILKDTYRKHSMQEFIRILTESIAVKRLQNNWI